MTYSMHTTPLTPEAEACSSEIQREEYRIRLATPDDLMPCVILLSELFSIEKDFSPDTDLQMKGLLAILASPASGLFVAEAQQTDTANNKLVVGMASAQLTISTAQGGYSVLVEDVAVTGQFRRCGIGSALLQSIEIWGKQHGATRMQLLADIENIPALHFYKSRNWQQTQLVNIRKYIP